MEKVCGALVVGLLLFTVPTLLFSSGLGRIRSPGLYAVDNLVVGTCGSTKPSLQFTLVKTTTEHRDGEGEYLYSSVDESWECKASVTTKWKAVRWYESKLPIAYSYTPTSELSKDFTCRYSQKDYCRREATAWARTKTDDDGDGFCYSYDGDTEWYMGASEALANSQSRLARVIAGCVLIGVSICLCMMCCITIFS